MRDIARTLVLVVGLAVAGNAFAAAPKATPANSAPQAAKKTSTAATHTVKGTVKSLDNSTLVLTPKKGSEMTFALDTSTTKQGAPAVGSDVSVKYHTEGTTMMATTIAAQPAKQVASAKPASSKKTTK